MLLNVLLLLVGFIVLIKGADFMVGGASSIARKMNVSGLVIGLTIVAFGTSAPEMTVNVINSYHGRNEAIFGNVIGSNIFNLLFILGVTGLIYPLVVQKSSVKYEVPLSLLSVGMLWILVNDQFLVGNNTNELNRLNAVVLLSGFLTFMYYIYRSMRSKPLEEETSQIKEFATSISVLMVIGGVAMLVGGGYLVTENAVAIAKWFNMSEKLIGLTILAVGTSLPELATSAVAAYKRNTDIAIGNIIGSNIFNVFLILGVNGLIRPIAYNAVLNTDLLVLGIGTVLLLISMFTLSQNKIDRWEAFVFLVVYAGYTYYLFERN